MKILFTQFRLLLCVWLFQLIAKIAPADHFEGAAIIRMLYFWSTQNITEEGK